MWASHTVSKIRGGYYFDIRSLLDVGYFAPLKHLKHTEYHSMLSVWPRVPDLQAYFPDWRGHTICLEFLTMTSWPILGLHPGTLSGLFCVIICIILEQTVKDIYTTWNTFLNTSNKYADCKSTKSQVSQTIKAFITFSDAFVRKLSAVSYEHIQTFC